MKNDDWNLSYWTTGEWQVIEERLAEYARNETPYYPSRDLLFSSLDSLTPERVKVCIIGQDPYRNSQHATGIPFSVPQDVGPRSLPPSLKNIFKEYQSDLGYPAPKNGDLTPWINQGVLLWNAYPIIAATEYCHWPELGLLTTQIIERLDGENEVVFILLGSTARSLSRCIKHTIPIETSHPSPLGANKGFLGSKIFSKANGYLEFLGKEPINWRLPDDPQEARIDRSLLRLSRL